MNVTEITHALALLKKRADDLHRAADVVENHLQAGLEVRDLFLRTTLNVVNHTLKSAYDNLAYAITTDTEKKVEEGRKAIDSQ